MRIAILVLLIAFAFCLRSAAQGRITGPLGVYHIAAGYSYSDTLGIDSVTMQSEFRFGDLEMPDQSIDNGFGFVPQLDSCRSWNANRVFGIIQPPTEHGVYDQPADTALYAPYPQLSGPGMIQGGARFSALSQLYGGFCGVILDDWNGDTSITHQVRDAVQGKYVDATGNVHSDCMATTPYNKLFCVVYNTNAVPAAMSVLDGVVYSIRDQNCCYTTFDGDISTLRNNFPRKEIMFAIFLNNTYLGGWTTPASVQYLLQHALDRYDDGDINGLTIFAGPYLMKDRMPLSIWNGFALPHCLDSIYYPYLGAGQGRIYDCHSGNVLIGASVRVFCEGRVSGDTLMRSYQKTDTDGHYQFGLWAGNRNTDSTHYWLIAEKDGYRTDTLGFWVKRGDHATLPDILLCPGITGSNNNMLVYPNPGSGRYTVQVEAAEVGAEIEVYDMLGEKVYAGIQNAAKSYIDLSGRTDGLYLILIKATDNKYSGKALVLLRR